MGGIVSSASSVGGILNPLAGAKKFGGAVGGFFGSDKQFLGADPIAGELKQNQLAASRNQRFALEQLRERAGEDPTGLARLGAEREISGLQTGVEDLRRQQKSQIARRGLGATSLGQGALAGAQQNVAQRTAAIRASIPERIAQLRQQRTQALLSGATGVVSSQDIPIRFQDQTIKTPGFGQQLLLAGAGGASRAAFG